MTAYEVARLWREAWEVAEDGTEVPEACHGCACPATSGHRDEDGALCPACWTALEQEGLRQSADALTHIAVALGMDIPYEPADVVAEAAARITRLAKLEGM